MPTSTVIVLYSRVPFFCCNYLQPTRIFVGFWGWCSNRSCDGPSTRNLFGRCHAIACPCVGSRSRGTHRGPWWRSAQHQQQHGSVDEVTHYFLLTNLFTNRESIRYIFCTGHYSFRGNFVRGGRQLNKMNTSNTHQYESMNHRYSRVVYLFHKKVALFIHCSSQQYIIYQHL